MFPCQGCGVLRSSCQRILDVAPSETSPCRRAGYAKRRARPPRGDGEQSGRRRGNRDPRALWEWSGCSPRRLQLVCTRSSGRNSLCRRCCNRCCCNRGRTPSGSLVCSSVTGPGANPSVAGSDVCRSETKGLEAHKKVSNVAVVVNAPVRRAAPQTGPEFASIVAPVPFLSWLFFLLIIHSSRSA